MPPTLRLDGRSCECDRPQGQCVKGDMERCSALDDDDTMICPVTGNPCMTEHDQHCEDYGCARSAGILVEDEWS